MPKVSETEGLPLDVPLDLAPCLLQQPAERHAGGTRGLARAAPQAAVHVSDEVRAEADPALGGRAHEVDTPARRVHLLLEHQVGRALGQANAAVHAVEDALPVRRLIGVEGAERTLDRPGIRAGVRGRAHRQIPPT